MCLALRALHCAPPLDIKLCYGSYVRCCDVKQQLDKLVLIPHGT